MSVGGQRHTTATLLPEKRHRGPRRVGLDGCNTFRCTGIRSADRHVVASRCTDGAFLVLLEVHRGVEV